MCYWIMAILVSMVTGCTVKTPEQKAEIEKSTAAIKNGASELQALYYESKNVQDAIAGIIKKMTSGELPALEAKELIAALRNDQDNIKSSITGVKDSIDAARESIAKLQSEGLSIWEILGSIGGSLLMGAIGLRGGQKVRAKSGFMGI